MIAAGICLMGGCFAQDEFASVVETYWPTHSVHLDLNADLQLVGFDGGPSLPFWTTGMRCGGRLENISSSGSAVEILGWGTWRIIGGRDVKDALYLGCMKSGDPRVFVSAGCVYVTNYASGGAGFSSAGKVDYMSVEADENKINFTSSLGDEIMPLDGITSSTLGTGRLILKVNGCKYDMVSWWFYNTARGDYYMVQPMCSAWSGAAFFIHGYSTLVEI